jgi:hypothetical protein
MKKLFVALMLLAFATTATLAIAADTYNYEGKQGKVVFNHKGHTDIAKGKCDGCHQGTPAKIAVTKDSAHGAVCKDCHKAKGGPTKCGDCHKK